MNNKFKIGDILLVTSNGQSYSTYEAGARQLGISNIWVKGRWGSDHLVDGVSEVEVLSFMEDKGDILYGVKSSDGKGWVIGEEGLAIVRRAEPNPVIHDCVSYAKGVIEMNDELQTLRQEVESLRTEVDSLRQFKQRVMEAVQ